MIHLRQRQHGIHKKVAVAHGLLKTIKLLSQRSPHCQHRLHLVIFVIRQYMNFMREIMMRLLFNLETLLW